MTGDRYSDAAGSVSGVVDGFCGTLAASLGDNIALNTLLDMAGDAGMPAECRSVADCTAWTYGESGPAGEPKASPHVGAAAAFDMASGDPSRETSLAGSSEALLDPGPREMLLAAARDVADQSDAACFSRRDQEIMGRMLGSQASHFDKLLERLLDRSGRYPLLHALSCAVRALGPTTPGLALGSGLAVLGQLLGPVTEVETEAGVISTCLTLAIPAPSGAGKNAAMSLAPQLFAALGLSDLLHEGLASAQALEDHLASRGFGFINFDEVGTRAGGGAVPWDRLVDLTTRSRRGLIGRSHANDASDRASRSRVFLSGLLAGTPHNLLSQLTAERLASGLGSRILVIPGAGRFSEADLVEAETDIKAIGAVFLHRALACLREPAASSTLLAILDARHEGVTRQHGRLKQDSDLLSANVRAAEEGGAGDKVLEDHVKDAASAGACQTGDGATAILAAAYLEWLEQISSGAGNAAGPTAGHRSGAPLRLHIGDGPGVAAVRSEIAQFAALAGPPSHNPVYARFSEMVVRVAAILQRARTLLRDPHCRIIDAEDLSDACTLVALSLVMLERGAEAAAGENSVVALARLLHDRVEAQPGQCMRKSDFDKIKASHPRRGLAISWLERRGSLTFSSSSRGGGVMVKAHGLDRLGRSYGAN